MGKKSKLAALALGTFMAMGLACFTACEGAAGKDGKSAYDIWLEQGNTGTEQDFLDSLKGTPGQPGTPGSAPEITVGENGNWFVNGVDTNHKAQGENGQPGSMPEITISDDGYWEINGQKTAQKAQGENGQPGSAPEITISDDGYWEIDGQKTSQKAQGENGQPGKDGKAGNKITHGEGAPTSTEGAVEGDMYVDTKEWNVYFFEGGSWKNYGSFKGEEVGPEEEEKSWTYELDFTHEAQIKMPIDDMPEGAYIMEVDLNTETADYGSQGLRAYVDNTSNRYTYFSLSESKSSPDHNVYHACVYVKQGSSNLVFIGPRVKTTVTIKNYTMPALKADGQDVEVPANLVGAATNAELAVFKFKIDDSVGAGSYSLKLTPDNKQGGYRVYIEGTAQIMRQSNFSGKTFTYNATDQIAYACINMNSDTEEWQYVHFVKISLTAN